MLWLSRLSPACSLYYPCFRCVLLQALNGLWSFDGILIPQFQSMNWIKRKAAKWFSLNFAHDKLFPFEREVKSQKMLPQLKCCARKSHPSKLLNLWRFYFKYFYGSSLNLWRSSKAIEMVDTSRRGVNYRQRVKLLYAVHAHKPDIGV